MHCSVHRFLWQQKDQNMKLPPLCIELDGVGCLTCTCPFSCCGQTPPVFKALFFLVCGYNFEMSLNMMIVKAFYTDNSHSEVTVKMVVQPLVPQTCPMVDSGFSLFWRQFESSSRPWQSEFSITLWLQHYQWASPCALKRALTSQSPDKTHLRVFLSDWCWDVINRSLGCAMWWLLWTF